MQSSTHTTNQLLAATGGRRVSLTLTLACITFGLFVVDVSPASSVPPRLPRPSTGSHRYPPAFEAFMVVEFGDLWMHTVQEQVIRRMYLTWREKQERKD